MGEILPFVARVRDSGEWTASERARLDALADQFARAGIHVEVIYGATDDGDPWCVVKDANEDVLVHVARIGAKFVVHFAAHDTLEEGADLPSALSARLDELVGDPHAAQDGQDAVVVPFNLAGRQAQSFLALIVATAFFYETRGALAASDAPHEAAPPSDGVDPSALTAAPLDAAEKPERDLPAHSAALTDPTPERGAAAQAWTAAEEAHTPVARPASGEAAAPAPAAPEAKADTPVPAIAAPIVTASVEGPQTLTGTAGNDRLVGGAGADLIRGGAGNDTLQGGGAGHGQLDTLDGGAGDDRIELNAQVVATGGDGADTFVIQAPAAPDHPETLLGVITDFDATHGDRLVDFHGFRVAVVGGPPSLMTSQGFSPNARPLLPPPGEPEGSTHVYVDLNGDGQADGYVLMIHPAGEPHAPAGSPALEPHETAFVTGASLNTHFELS